MAGKAGKHNRRKYALSVTTILHHMSILYIANVTKSRHEFMYTVPELDDSNGRPMAAIRQPIDPGGQIRVSRELNPFQLESVINHHRQFGMICVDEVSRSRTYAPLVYQVDKPVTYEKIVEALHRNDMVLERRGEDMRRDAAIAVTNSIQRTMREEQIPGTLTNLEMSVDEEERGDRPDELHPVAHGVRVSPLAQPGIIESVPVARGAPRTDPPVTRSRRRRS